MLREDNCHWPPHTNDGFVIFGEESVSRLAKQFVLSTRAAVQAFRNYKLEGGKPELELKRLFAETLPGSSAKCERAFCLQCSSEVNSFSEIRATFTVVTLSSCASSSIGLAS